MLEYRFPCSARRASGPLGTILRPVDWCWECFDIYLLEDHEGMGVHCTRDGIASTGWGMCWRRGRAAGDM